MCVAVGLVACISSIMPAARSTDDTLLVIVVRFNNNPDDLEAEYLVETDSGLQLKVYANSSYAFFRGLSPGKHRIVSVAAIDLEGHERQRWGDFNIPFSIESGGISMLSVAFGVFIDPINSRVTTQTLELQPLGDDEVTELYEDLKTRRSFDSWRTYTSVVQPELPADAGRLSLALDVVFAVVRGVIVCFLPGTPILTDGGLLPIESIEVGTIVSSCDPSTGLWSSNEVTEVFLREYEGDLVVVSAGGDTIRVTPEHPFWVLETGKPGGRWVTAKSLRAGDRLLTPIGSVSINSIRHEQINSPVYNIQVAGTHTYAVGAISVLVHNKGSREHESNP